MSLRVHFWGTRGSIPSPGRETVRYGGNTPCLELRTPEGWLIVLDAGTGIRELGRSLMDRAHGAPIRGDIFLTHAHWDHIQGLPFFAPIFHPGNQFTIWGSKAMETSIGRVVRDQMSPVVFPVAFEQLAATIEFRELAEGHSMPGNYDVSVMPVQHPGGALAFRFASRAIGAPVDAPPGASRDGATSRDVGAALNGHGRGLVYISDNELRPAAPYEFTATWRRDLVRFVHGARVLVHDAMFTAEEYAHHHGWGHSTYEDAVELALEAEVETLVLFHHKPERTDDEVDRRTDDCRTMAAHHGGSLRVVAAAEGLTLTV
jgi:phosphoribosyl 1,2-cyclic phosphodiesterase